MFHTIVIVGNLGREPEMRFTSSGAPVTSFNVATNRTYTNSIGEKVKETIWFRVSAWGKDAENCKNYLRSGSKVLVEGRLVPDVQTGGPRIFSRQNGTMGASYEVSASTVRFLNSKGEGGAPEMEGEGLNLPGGEEEEIPF